MYIARQFSHRGISVIETYPSAMFRALGLVDRVELRDARARAAMLAPFVEPFDWATGDEVDAVCAAAAAAGWLRAGEPDTTDDIWVKV
jgi:predicted nuclease with RNAse H fold